MGDILDTLVDFFQQEDWTYEQLPDLPIFRLGMTGRNGKWVGYAQAREEQDQAVFYSVCPANVPEDRRMAMAEFMARVNYGLVIGNFEMDFHDGEVRYKTSIDVENDRLTPALVRNMIVLNLQMMDRCLPGIMAVAFGDVAPEEAVSRIQTSENLPS